MPTTSALAEPGTGIPEDYPHEWCPIYKPSAIVDIERIHMLDGELYFILELVSEDERAEIESFYEALPDFTATSDHGAGVREVFLETDEGDEAFVKIEPVGDSMASYRDQGYKTYVTITVKLYL